MMKKTKIRLIIISIVFALLILCVPIPICEEILYDNSTALTLNSLTYKIIFWNAYEYSEKPYNDTEIIFLPNNYTSASEIFENRSHELHEEGYGAISITVLVEKLIIMAFGLKKTAMT